MRDLPLPSSAPQWHPKPRKRTTPAQVKALLLQQLLAAYGPSWAQELADHIDSGGDMYITVLFT